MAGRFRAAVAALLVGLVLAGCGGGGDGESRAPGATSLPADPGRLAGDDAAGTAAVVSAARFPSASDVVIVNPGKVGLATGAAYVAGSHQSPVLYADRDGVPDVTLDEIERLGAYHARLFGGRDVLGEGVEDDLRDAGVEVERLEGEDDAAIAAAAAANSGAPNIGVRGALGRTVLLVGDDPRFALLAGQLSFGQQWPVLESGRRMLRESTRGALLALEIRHAVVVGDEQVIGPGVVAAVEAAGLTVERIGAADPPSLAAAVADFSVAIGNPSPTTVHLVAAGRPADLLVAGPLAVPDSALLLCADTADCGGATTSWLQGNRTTVQRIVVVGDARAVSDGARRTLEAAAG